MTPAATLRTFGWLIRDTFRQSRASGVFWILLAISVLAIAVCASATIEGGGALAYPGENPDFLPRLDPDAQDRQKADASGVLVVSGDLKLAFGAIRIPLARDPRGAVHFLELVLAGGVADTLGLLLTLIWTAGFLPGFLEARSVAVLLAKPVPRWQLLAGKYLGVLVFVLASAALFVGGTWLTIGLRTGIWDAAYLYAIPLLVLHFAMFFSVSVLLAVWTQSTVVCVFGSILFWALAWSINYGRHGAERRHRDGQRWVVLRRAGLVGRRGLLGATQAGGRQSVVVQSARGRQQLRPAVRLCGPRGARILVRLVDRHVAAVYGGGVGARGPRVYGDRLLNARRAGAEQLCGCDFNLRCAAAAAPAW